MKTHAIIPIFIPHLGCPHTCVFCNQRAITARTPAVTENDVRKTAEEYLSTLENKAGIETEISFFGGSFTGIPIEEQSRYLNIAKEYKDAGRVSKIHLSTRPDYINRKILDNLKAYGVDVIELGVQSCDPAVLELSERGHGIEEVENACSLINEYGFTLGIQLMTGLPGDSKDSCMKSVRKTIELKPRLARLYPTVIISGTKLAEMYTKGRYVPFTLDESVDITAAMYKALTEAGINVIRVGLKASSLISDEAGSCVLGNSYHPAFRQLVEGKLARDEIEEQIIKAGLKGFNGLEVHAGSKAFSNAIGHKGCNKQYFAGKFPEFNIKYISDKDCKDRGFRFTFI